MVPKKDINTGHYVGNLLMLIRAMRCVDIQDEEEEGDAEISNIYETPELDIHQYTGQKGQVDFKTQKNKMSVISNRSKLKRAVAQIRVRNKDNTNWLLDFLNRSKGNIL